MNVQRPVEMQWRSGLHDNALTDSQQSKTMMHIGGFHEISLSLTITIETYLLINKRHFTNSFEVPSFREVCFKRTSLHELQFTEYVNCHLF